MDYFSRDYFEARNRFVSAVNQAGLTHLVYPIQAKGPNNEQLSIDVGIRSGASTSSALVVSSGLHGIEGYFGSAVQLALLDNQHWLEMAADHTLVFLHALNPFGFAWDRRSNEHNVDLNRSFFRDDQERAATSKGFHALMCFLAPGTPPSRFDTFPLELAVMVLRYGRSTLKREIPAGQYDYPRCLFYGGQSDSETQAILSANLREWVGGARCIQLIDLHTGLGDWGSYKILPSDDAEDEEVNVIQRVHGADLVEDQRPNQSAQNVAYPAFGTFLPWFKAQFSDRECYPALAEFGTYSMFRVLPSLRAENRAYLYGDLAGKHAWARNNLMEVFAPASPSWRAKMIEDANALFLQALSWPADC